MKWREDFSDAFVSMDARIEDQVVVGAGAVIHAGVQIGAGSRIDEHCVIGHWGQAGTAPGLRIESGSIIRSHTVIYKGSSFGPRLETGHHVVIREGTRAGENLRVGNFCDIEGDCEIGDYCRFHGYVHVGKGTRIGNFVWLFSLTTATNDPLPPSNQAVPVRIEDGAVVCVGVTLMPGTVIGKGAFVSANAYAAGEIPPGAVIAGADGKIVSHVSNLMHLPSGSRHPWMRHFDRGLPAEVQPRLRKLMEEVLANRHTLALHQQ